VLEPQDEPGHRDLLVDAVVAAQRADILKRAGQMHGARQADQALNPIFHAVQRRNGAGRHRCGTARVPGPATRENP
jgi:hypothetical protein